MSVAEPANNSGGPQPIRVVHMDRWLVFPPGLHAALEETWCGLSGSLLMALRMECGAVQGFESMRELGRRAAALVHIGQPTVRVVLQDIEDILLSEMKAQLTDVAELAAGALHLYAFRVEAEGVLVSLATPELGMQQALEDGDAVVVAAADLRHLADDAGFQRRYRAACVDWWQGLQACERAWAAEEPLLSGLSFDWQSANLSLSADRHLNVRGVLGAVPVFANLPPEPTEPSVRGKAYARWTWQHEDLPDDAIALQLAWSRHEPSADGWLDIRLHVSEALGPMPTGLTLTLPGGLVLARLINLRWNTDDDKPTHAAARSKVAWSAEMRSRLAQQVVHPLGLRADLG